MDNMDNMDKMDDKTAASKISAELFRRQYNDGQYVLVLDIDDVSMVVRDKVTKKYYYWDEDTENVQEVQIVARLVYTVDHDISKDVADDILWDLFDNYVCGERTMDDHIEYLWFEEVE